MKRTLLPGLLCALLAAPPTSAATLETVVLLRHGEKPAAGLGQLDCRGLNRALALPAVLSARFGRPDLLFAPNPGQRKKDGGTAYNYIRPLATLEPTAISLGLPVNTDYGLDDGAALEQALTSPALARAMVWVAWEHHAIEDIAKHLLRANGGMAEQVPEWKGDDFDSLWIVRIERDGASVHSRFSRLQQGLNGQATRCPGPAVQ
ncbi:hypothetical protein [Paludibacterium yongneupense]|uniref:hypothetical protein n=1 Tax=Paludibacterium yongneupense TaxID=400061 RepID=UPI0003FBD9AE|nr:hypothetical protein [Paludibacterium yongneupense]